MKPIDTFAFYLRLPIGWIGRQLCLAGMLALTLQTAGAVDFSIVHAFSNFGTDGSRPSYECSFTQSGSTLYGMTTSGGASGTGALFQINTDGNGFSIIHDFTGVSANGPANTNRNDGALPYGTPVLSDNVLYGSTASGGSNSSGCVFVVNTDGNNFQLLHHFGPSGGNHDGYSPQGSLILAGSSLFGVTANGGLSLQGMIFTLGTDGSGYHALYNFTNTGGDGQNPAGSLALSGSTLYGMTQFGGTAGKGTLFRINTDGSGYQILHNFGIGIDGANPLGSVIVSGTTIYGMTTSGGSALGSGTIFKQNTDGTGYQKLYSFSSPQAYSPLGALTLVGSKLYGLTSAGRGTGVSGNGAGTAFQINTDGTGFQFIHNFPVPPTTTDGSYPYATLFQSGIKLLGMTRGGGSSQNAGSIFALVIGNSGATSGAVKVVLNPAGSVAAGGQWQVDAGTFRNSGSTASGLSAGAHTIAFKPITGWITPANQDTTITLGVTNSIVGTYVAADITKPTASVTNLPVGGNVSNNLFTIKGKAADNVAVTNVLYSLNNSVWIGATTGNSWTNWFASLDLTPGTNLIATYAVDSSGNLSITNKVKLVYILSAPLTVRTNGKGSISPALNNALLQIGRNYTLTATPAFGFAFTNWTDGSSSIITNKPALTFQMASNLSFTANFIDITKPGLTVLAPTAATSAVGESYAANGKASDNAAVASVYYNLNNFGWLPPATTNNWTNWSVTLDLAPGTNYFSAYAVDTSGNLSATNLIKFLYPTAPTTLNGLAAKTTPDGGVTFGTAFGATTFSQVATDPNNANAVGAYTYTKQTPSSGVLRVTYTEPPTATNEGLQTIQLMFTAPLVARFTNGIDTGGIRFTTTPTLVPASILNQTLLAVNQSGSGESTAFATGKYIRSNLLTHVANTNNGYTYTTYGPLGALLKHSDSNGQDYTIITFLGTNYGTAYSESYDPLGHFVVADQKVFGVKSQKPSGNAPNSITNRSVVVFNGLDTSKFNFPDAANFNQVDILAETSTLGTGTYAYGRTGTNTADLNLNFTSPAISTESTQFQFIAPNFATFTNLDATFGAAVIK